MTARIPPSFDEADCLLPQEAPCWYVVRTNVRGERRAEASIREALTGRGPDCQVYLPCETRIRKHARSSDRVQYPLFVRYMFVCIRVSDIHIVRSCDGVEAFVGSSGQPRPIRNPGFVYQLQRDEESGLFDMTQDPDAILHAVKGLRVAVTHGPFTGHIGEIMSKRGDGRVAILLAALNGPLNVPVAHLKAA